MLDRVNSDVVPFGSTAQGTERTVFGASTQSDAIDDNVNTSYIRGWGIVGINDAPTKQDFNAMVFTSSYLTAYLYQQGIATYNLLQKYYINSRCTGSDGNIYRSLTGTSATPNVGNDPVGDAVNWKADFSDINTLTAKTTPVDADEFAGADSADTFALKKFTWANIKATLAATFVSNDSRVKTALNASGTAPIYACRAWVNFDGTGTVAIRASGNVSSITDNGTGDYTTNFIVALIDADYSYSVSCQQSTTNTTVDSGGRGADTSLSGSLRLKFFGSSNNTVVDPDLVAIAIFR